MAENIKVDPKELSVIKRINEEEKRSKHEKWGIESSLRALLGSNTGYYIQQVEEYANIPKNIVKELKEKAKSYVEK